MSGKDRLVILCAVLCMLAGLGGAGLFIPAINEERVDLQLTANEQVFKNMPPGIAVTQAMLGSFRGLAVDMLWARAEQMKQDGQFYEAMELSRMITLLQPRFPQVWSFQAWNMAYNISVATHTPEERFKWVNAGVKLLRDEGIPLNPNSVLLYKELAWIFLHKIGQFSDDLHWYYKQELAKEWHEVLGAPPTGPSQEVIEAFRPIADAYEKYVSHIEPTRETRKELERLIADAELDEPLSPLRSMTLDRMQSRLHKLDAEWGTRNSRGPKIQKLMAMVDLQKQQSGRDPVQRLLDAEPDVRPVLESLRKLNLGPDLVMLRMIAVSDAQRDSGKAVAPTEAAAGAPAGFREWLDDAATKKPREALIALVRARVLDETYKMDPLWMLELMEGAWFVPEEMREKPTPIPVDWRHPAAHGLYWSSLGVRRYKGLIRGDDYDILNTDRQVLHSLQQLTETGKLVFHYHTDPALVYYDLLPEPRYIDAYHFAVFGSQDRISSKRMKESAAAESFQAGHENFLIWATQLSYFYGDQAKAEEYYGRLRRDYSTFKPDRAERYSRQLEEFVLGEFVKSEMYTSREDTASAIHGFLATAITKGWGNSQPEVARRFIGLAIKLHQLYQKKQDYKSTTVTPQERNRMALKPFAQMFTDALEYFLVNDQSPKAVEVILTKSRAWLSAPDDLRRRVMVRPGVEQKLTALAKAVNLNPQLAFPEPPGMAEYREKYGKKDKEEAVPEDQQPLHSELERK
jgi:hypothetical protein